MFWDFKKVPLFISCLLFATLKLWLVADQETVATLHQHDDLWYVSHAASVLWGRSYDSLAIAHLPSYSSFIVINRLSGFPLRLATELLYIASAWSLASSVAKIGVLPIIRLFIFVAIVFHPHSIALFNYTGPDPFTACLYLLLVAQLVRVLDQPSSSLNAIGLAVVVATLFLARKESAGLLTILLLLVAAAIWIWRKRLPAGQYAAAIILAPMLATATAWAIFAIGNGLAYGVWLPTDIDMARQAYSALQSIEVENPQRFIPIPKETRLKAYSVSPSFAELQPLLDGPKPSWGETAGSDMGLKGDIGAGWMHWMLRWGAQELGYFREAATAQAFFDRIAGEIATAQADGRLKKRWTLGGFLDPAVDVWLPELPKSLRAVALAAWPTALTHTFTEAAQTSELYDRTTNRRSFHQISPVREKGRQFVADWYVAIWLGLLLIALTVAIFQADGWSDLHRTTLLIVAALVLSRIGLFTVIDASAWQANQARYMFPIGTLVMIFPFLALPGRSSSRAE